MGFLFEEFISNLMEVKGLEVEAGVEVELAGFTGHIDRVVNGTVMEIKTMNSKYFEEFTKSPNNARGYYTQLALYAVLYRAEDNCCWLCLNKDTGEIRLVIPERQTLISYWDSACENLETLLQFNSLEDVANYKLPAPRPEIFKGKVTGKLLIPQEFYGFTHVDCFYELRYGQNGYKQDRFYVANQLKPDHILECLINRAEDIINDSIIGQESRVPDGDNSLCSGEG